jgi:hyperosmotically inducible periplasmic protein
MKSFQATLIVAVALTVGCGTYVSAMAQGASASSMPTEKLSKSEKAENRALQKTVRRALAKTKGLSVTNILVKARSGAVTLQGSVPESQQIELATETTQHVSGVTSVTNNLSVRAVAP